MPATAIQPVLTPQGHLVLAPVADAPPLPTDLQQRLSDSFGRGAGHGLLQLGAGEVGTALPAALSFWREFGARYVTALCTTPDAAVAPLRFCAMLKSDVVRLDRVKGHAHFGRRATALPLLNVRY